jgi:hypothetical protein
MKKGDILIYGETVPVENKTLLCQDDCLKKPLKVHNLFFEIVGLRQIYTRDYEEKFECGEKVKSLSIVLIKD